MEGREITILDSQKFPLKIQEFTSSNGEIWTLPPTFTGAKQVIENMDKLQLKSDDVILTSYPKAGRD